MFPDSHIANDYSLRPQKLSYVVSHGTSYYFNNELIKDVRKAHGFLLLFDETTIVGVRKQLEIFSGTGLQQVTVDVEWGFPQNNHLVTDERSSLNEASINGLRATNAGIKFFGDSKVHMAKEGSKRLAAAINNKTFDDLSTAEVLVTATNTKLAALKTQLIVNSENLNRLRKKTRKNEIIYDLNKHNLNTKFLFRKTYQISTSI
ncbi:unnamed protein product [Rotaria socialis]|uniref:Uncharacterized protein n=1 Tax=Rotaria socialis TaxID=392032 RepID=A0A821JGZ8_9BILA|nr:unnamed protein product [Rotaria socialis]